MTVSTVVFERLIFNNFKSFVTQQEINLLTMGAGLHFLKGHNISEDEGLGSNGAGKTTIADAISWCLYGKTAEGLRNPDIAPGWDVHVPTFTSVRVRRDGKVYDIVRTTAPNQVSVNDKPGEPEQVLGMSFETFHHTVMLGQGQPLFFDLTPGDKLTLFGTVLNLKRWDQRSDAAKAAAQDTQRQHDEMTGRRKAVYQQSLQAEDRLERLEIDAKAWDDEAAKRARDHGKEIAALTKRHDVLTTQINEANSKLDGALTELKSVGSQIREEQTRHQDAVQTLTTAKIQNKALLDRIGEIGAEIDKLGNGKTCPVCKQSVKGTALFNHVSKLEFEIERIRKGVHADKKLKEFGQKIDKHSGTLRTLIDAETHHKDVRDDAQQTLNTHTGEHARLAAEINVMKKAVTERDKEPNPHTPHIQELRRLIKQADKQIAIMDDDLKFLERAIERRTFWITGFRDIRLYIVEQVLDELEIAANAVLSDLGMSRWEIRFEIEKENKKGGGVQRGLHVFILSPRNDKPVRWENWSGGEKQRLRLAGSLALSEVLLNHASITPSLEILDEPTTHLSPEGVRDLCDGLADRADRLQRCILYADQQSVESSRFASIISVTKDKNGSTIRVQGN